MRRFPYRPPSIPPLFLWNDEPVNVTGPWPDAPPGHLIHLMDRQGLQTHFQTLDAGWGGGAVVGTGKTSREHRRKRRKGGRIGHPDRPWIHPVAALRRRISGSFYDPEINAGKGS